MRKERNIRLLTAVLACLLLALASTCLCGCLGLSTKVSPAATVNGTVIDEADVTAYIEGFRSEDESRETDSGWAQYLSEKGYTAETLRSYVLNTVFIPNTMIALESEKREIVVTDDELDGIIDNEKQYYEQRYGADTWESVLASFGYDEASWRQSETTRLLRGRLSDEVIGDVKPSDSELQAHAASIVSNYNGKHSYFVVFNSEDSAAEALSSLGGEGALISKSALRKVGKKYMAAKDAVFVPAAGAEAPSYTQADGMVNAGWSSLDNYKQSLSAVYTNALNAMSEDTVSPVVDLENGTWALIFCDEAFVAEEGDSVNLDKIPAAIYDQVYEDVVDAMKDEKLDEWLKDATKKANVVVNSMPEGLPYDVNVSLG